MENLLITGANRGIGLELTRQALQLGHRVFAGCRKTSPQLLSLEQAHPTSLHVLSNLDVTSPASREKAVEWIGNQLDHLDLLINNAGVMHRHEQPGNLDGQLILDTLGVNAVAPILLAQECLPLLEDSPLPRVLNVSSQLGSLQNKQTGGYYSYCASKAALNMLSKTLAFDLRSRGVIVVMVHPGWVQTDMGGHRAPLTAEESASGLLRLAGRLALDDTAKFFTWEGEEHPW